MNLDIRVRREKLGLTQRDIGDMLNLSAATISNIESGQYGYYRESYEEILVKLEKERMCELIEVYPRWAGRYLGELASTRPDEQEPPNPGLRAA